jgi:hypothetical protein
MAGRITVSHNLGAIPAGGGCGTCPGGDRFLFVNHKGQVSPCTWVSEHRPAMAGGSLADAPLSVLLQSSDIAGFRRVAKALAGRSVCPMADLDGVRAAEDALAAIAPDGSRFSPVAPIYAFATERLAYFPDLRMLGARVLTVGGSGDHVIEACLAGAASVTAVDVNRRAAYWAELKTAALGSLPFAAFLRFLMRGPDALDRGIYLALRQHLGVGASTFWDGAYAASGGDGRALRESALFNNLHDSADNKCRNSSYLQSEAAYLKARAAVRSARREWFTARLEDWILTPGGAGPWDAAVLSNLAEHSHRLFPGEGHPEAFRDRVVRPVLERMHPAGRVMFGYVFDAGDMDGSSRRNPFNSPDVRRCLYGALPGWRLREVAFASATGIGRADAAAILAGTEVG